MASPRLSRTQCARLSRIISRKHGTDRTKQILVRAAVAHEHRNCTLRTNKQRYFHPRALDPLNIARSTPDYLISAAVISVAPASEMPRPWRLHFTQTAKRPDQRLARTRRYSALTSRTQYPKKCSLLRAPRSTTTRSTPKEELFSEGRTGAVTTRRAGS